MVNNNKRLNKAIIHSFDFTKNVKVKYVDLIFFVTKLLLFTSNNIKHKFYYAKIIMKKSYLMHQKCFININYF